MPLRRRQRGPIALYGATGYTGRLTAAELSKTQAEFVISGRNRARLEGLAEELGGDVGAQPASMILHRCARCWTAVPR